MAPDPPSGRRNSSTSESSSASVSSTVPPLSVPKRSLYSLNTNIATATTTNNSSPTATNSPSPRSTSVASNASLPNFSRPSAPPQLLPPSDLPPRKASPLAGMMPHDALKHHRPRQHSQGFFEPSLPTATMSEQQLHLHGQQQGGSAQMSASRIAAQAAMQHQNQNQQHQNHNHHHGHGHGHGQLPGQNQHLNQLHSASAQNLRTRSSTIPPQDNPGGSRKVSSPSPLPLSSPVVPPVPQRNASMGYHNGTVGGRSVAAATAANLAFPRIPGPAQLGQPFEMVKGEKEKDKEKEKEKSKMKLFSKPKHIISRSGDKEKDKEKDKGDKLDRPLPSPSKSMLSGPSGLSRMVNVSTASLNEVPSSGNSSMYNLSNSSVSTVVPTERPEKDKEKHKHHFLTRPKLKLNHKDKSDHHHLPLSSASSNSKPLDPNAPQSLYSFTPSSPSTTSFTKSMSGLDLRHGGRALREKKKEEKAEKAAAAAAAAAAAEEATLRDGEQSVFGDADPSALVASDLQMREILQGFGLHNMTPEDAWDFLKAKLLVIFEGEDVRIALEDLNKLVQIHIRRCVQKKMPSVIIEDLRDLLQTGFASINYSLLSVSDERIVPYLAQTWLFVFSAVLPYIQAVFLPLDQEFKGRGTIMSSREAAEFWGAVPDGESSEKTMGDQLDVRDIVLTTFRDTIILNRYESLKTTFSQLSLEKININTYAPSVSTSNGLSTRRPSTSSGPASLDPAFNSFNSQSSTVLNTPGSLSFPDNMAPLAHSHTHSSRARTTSNTSSGPDLPFLYSAAAPSTYSSSFSPPQPSILSQSLHPRSSPQHYPKPQSQTQMSDIDPSALITETVGRMFQCISVLCSVSTNDEAQEKMEELRRAIKVNWLGRGRTGRDRRGFVGMKVRAAKPVSMSELSIRGSGDWEGRGEGGARRVSVGGEYMGWAE